MGTSLRPVAIYLPQFHPIPENDKWWGKGFTEWTNVAKAKPLFKGHYQPHIPADLGFYDLRLPEVREQQAQLAKKHGIYGFCYYHYWFNGKRILERPFREVFESGKPDFPFMLCWANENWTRIWDGGDEDILLKQSYSKEDDRAHIQTLIPYFNDHRYIRINGKPVIAIYRSTLLPDPKRTTDIWREESRKQGLELYICRFETLVATGESYLREGGFDSAIDFQPWGGNYLDLFRNLYQTELRKTNIFLRGFRKMERLYHFVTNKEIYNIVLKKGKNIIDYEKYVDFIKVQPSPDYNWFPCVTPMWDNYARKKKEYFIFKNSSPEKYFDWLYHVANNYTPKSNEENLLFINAWNEWAEGNHLEPCKKWGLQYLRRTKEALSKFGN